MPASNSSDNPFLLLDDRIQRWIWTEGWTSLRDVQARAIPALIDCDQDVILAAATSSGKTEAAFFPILSNLVRRDPPQGLVVYISPLKALINDQWERLSGLCESLDLPVIKWHGDVTASRKQKFFRDPSGILLITPESLEAMFVNRGSIMPVLMACLRYVVVDELHAFMGTERGMQLQSLLQRLERAAGHFVPRVGLSATLGDMKLAAEFLRADPQHPVEVIKAEGKPQELKLLVRGFADNLDTEDEVSSTAYSVATHLYKALRGSNNLVFPNSRSLVEKYADMLRRMCENDGFPNEFWAHHGSLSRDLREDAERELKSGDKPANAICTSTLELGIDIGLVKSIAQIGPPPSVASLRQRMGRSGRRTGDPAILRCFCIEPLVTPRSKFSDRIHEGLLQTVAMVELLLKGWCEPPVQTGPHLSTFVQQVLSVIAKRGGVRVPELWDQLIARGPFRQVTRSDFTSILRTLGEKDLIIQDSAGELLHGVLGEKMVNHYEFYSAFQSDEEFRILAGGNALGSLPVTSPIAPGQGIIFAGRRWRVLDVDTEKKIISVTPSGGGAPPAFDSSGSTVHDGVRQQMREVLRGKDPVIFLDETASVLLEKSRNYYQLCSGDTKYWLEEGNSITLLTWKGDRVNSALALLLSAAGCQATNEGVSVSVDGTIDCVKVALARIAQMTAVGPQDLGLTPVMTIREKWDWALPSEVRLKEYISAYLNVAEAQKWARFCSAEL